MKNFSVALLIIFVNTAFTHAASADVTTGLVAYYPFYGSVYDESGYENHGKVYGATLVADRDGTPDSAYYFDGVDNYIEIPYSPNLSIGPNGFSVSLQVKADSVQPSNDSLFTIMDKSHGFGCLANASGWVVQGRTNVGTGFAVGNGTDYYGVSGPNILDDAWHDLTATFESGLMKLYVDGILTETRELPDSPANNAGPLYIGKWGCKNGRHFRGAVDEVRIFDRVLTEEDILQLSSHQTDDPPQDSEATLLGLLLDKIKIDKTTGKVEISGTLDVTDPAIQQLLSDPSLPVQLQLQTGGTEQQPQLSILTSDSVTLSETDSDGLLMFGLDEEEVDQSDPANDDQTDMTCACAGPRKTGHHSHHHNGSHEHGKHGHKKHAYGKTCHNHHAHEQE
jgi:hypothetical protein